MIVAQFYDDSIANSSFTCLDPQSKICFMTSELNDDLNLFKKVWPLRVTSSRPGSARPHGAGENEYFYNSLVVEIFSNRMHEIEFEIKYNFFKIDLAVSSIDTDQLSNSTKERLFSSSKRNCDFMCSKPSLAAAADNSSQTLLRICLDESLVCDGEPHCMFNNLDEINCEFRFDSIRV